MSRPRIGITAGLKVKETDEAVPFVQLCTNYSDAVALAGGLPIALVPEPDGGHPEEFAAMIDGLMMTGGPDLDPARCGQKRHPESKPLLPARDAFDIAVFHAMHAAGKPIFGICLGHQQINVALGGTLHQHVPEMNLSPQIEHRWLSRPRLPLPRHDVKIFEGTRLAKIVGAPRLSASSSHHQALDQVAAGLRPTATTPDGIVEGLESVDDDQILTVQWHPEYLTDEAPHRALFEDLVARARRQRAS